MVQGEQWDLAEITAVLQQMEGLTDSEQHQDCLLSRYLSLHKAWHCFALLWCLVFITSARLKANSALMAQHKP